MGKSKWEGKWKAYEFEKYAKFRLTADEEMIILRKNARLCPELMLVLAENPNWICPFPFECNRFPCGEPGCNADMCSNGYAYRYS